MIKYVYFRHHERKEDTYQDNKLIRALSTVIHDFEFGETAFESLSVVDGIEVLTEIEDVKWMYKRLQEEGVKDR